ARLRQRMRVPAGRIAVATEEAGSAPRSDDCEVAFLAHVALADVVLLPERGLDLLTDRLAVGLQRLEDLAEHLLGFPDDVLAGPDACRNALHVRFEVRRHLRLRNPFGMVFEGLDHRAPARRGPRILPFDELAIVEFLEDVMPRGLGSTADPFHLPDPPSLALPPAPLPSLPAPRPAPAPPP